MCLAIMKRKPRLIILAVISLLFLVTSFSTLTPLQKLWQHFSKNEVNSHVARDAFVKIQGNDASITSNKSDIARKKEIRHIGFLKVHKAASSTLQNVFYRFGLKRNLSFVLPTHSHYLSKLKYSYNKIMPPFSVHSPPHKRVTYDILCNHVVFNYDAISNLLQEDAVYVAIVREPFDLFLSAAYYYKYVWHFNYLVPLKDDTFVTDLIHDPHTYEAKTMAESMTFNPMAYDFGFDFTTVAEAEKITQETFEHFLNQTGSIFKLVMLVERFDESLIMLKRYLNWTLADILYLRNNEYLSKVPRKGLHITDKDMIKFRHRNRFDYGIYEYFKARFDKWYAKEIDIAEETIYFQSIMQNVNDYCLKELGKDSHGAQLTINASKWNTEFTVSEHDCNLMLKEELSFYQIMKARHLELQKWYGKLESGA